MCPHPPASHPRRVVLSDILRCVLCGDKAKEEAADGEWHVVLPCEGTRYTWRGPGHAWEDYDRTTCDGVVCGSCESSDWWGSPRDSCAGGIASMVRGPVLFTAAPAPPPGTWSNHFDGPDDRERATLAAMTIRALIEGPKADA